MEQTSFRCPAAGPSSTLFGSSCFPASIAATPGVSECLALTATHELGHAMGIFTHSSVASDITYVDPVVSELSARDVGTIERAYHVQPNVSVPVH